MEFIKAMCRLAQGIAAAPASRICACSKPAKAVDPRETVRVEQEVLAERRRSEERLRAGFAELKHTHSQIFAARQHMNPQVTAAHAAYLQAEADFKA
jgi:hypothetical protein